MSRSWDKFCAWIYDSGFLGRAKESFPAASVAGIGVLRLRYFAQDDIFHMVGRATQSQLRGYGGGVQGFDGGFHFGGYFVHFVQG